MTKYTDFVNYNLSMLTDQVRTEAFRQAIARTVRGNNVVVDLGTGSGVLAFFACQLVLVGCMPLNPKKS